MRNLICLALLSIGPVLQASPSQPIEGCTRVPTGYECQFEETLCSYQPAVSVLRIDHCGRKQGYIQFRDRSQEPVCPAVLEFYNGLFLSYEAWVEATPCGV